MYSLMIFSIHLTSRDCREEEISDFDTDLQNVWVSALLWIREDIELAKTWNGPYLWWIINQNLSSAIMHAFWASFE